MSLENEVQYASIGATTINQTEDNWAYSYVGRTSAATTESQLSYSLWAQVGLLSHAFIKYTLGPYVKPVLIDFGLVNNVVAIALLLSGHPRAKQLGILESMREYYMALVIADLFTLVASHVWNFVGGPRLRKELSVPRVRTLCQYLCTAHRERAERADGRTGEGGVGNNRREAVQTLLVPNAGRRDPLLVAHGHSERCALCRALLSIAPPHAAQHAQYTPFAGRRAGLLVGRHEPEHLLRRNCAHLRL